MGERNGCMKLHDIVEQGQFEEYYHSNGLRTVEDKISYLTRAMKIRATRGDDDETPAEALECLEELALLGYWKASW
jgi:hypothetical protein